MGISHPLSDEFYGGPRGGLALGMGGALMLSPERTPPSSPPSCCSPVDGQEDFLQHQVSRMDTLAGIAIKYGVQEDFLQHQVSRMDTLAGIAIKYGVQEDFLQHQVSRMDTLAGIAIKYGVQEDFLQHQVSRMDTLAGIAIKYGVQEDFLQHQVSRMDTLAGIAIKYGVQEDFLQHQVSRMDTLAGIAIKYAVQEDFLQHQVSRMDTLAGIAIKYGVQEEILDIKRANSLVTDSQMYAHKALLIPLPGRPMPSSMKLNGSSLRSKRAWAPNNQQNRDIVTSPDSEKTRQQQSSLAMSSLQSYYGLSSQRGDDMDLSTEMSLYSKGSSQGIGSEILPVSSSLPDSRQSTGRGNAAAKEKQDGSIRRRQKVESGTQDDLLSDSIKMIKSFLPRPVSSMRLSMDAGSLDPIARSNGGSFLEGFKSVVRRSPSAPSFADAENGGVSMWSSSNWTFNHESFTRPLLDGLPKPASGRRMKAVLD